MGSSTDPGTAYARAVHTGEIVAGRYVRAAAKRHLDDLDRQETEAFPYRYAPEKGERFCTFAEHLTLEQGKFEGEPFVLFPWQEFVFYSLFGWVREDGTRRFRKAYIEQSKGAGKSPVSASVGLWLLFADREPGAQIYVLAETRDQAKVVFDFCIGMFRRSEELSARGKVYGGTNPQRIFTRDKFLTILSRSRDGAGRSGRMPSGVLADEVHEFHNRVQLDLMEAGVKHRRQPLILLTTNTGSGFGNVCHQEHEYAKLVAEGRHEDPEHFALIYAVDTDDDPFESEECWIKANPSLPVIPGLDYLRRAVSTARGMPSKRSEVLRLNFGVWQDAADPWLDVGAWNECERDELTKDWSAYPSVVSLDLSTRTDLTAGVRATDFGDRVEVEAMAWTPAEGIVAREQKDGVPYRYWVEVGALRTTPGKIVGYPEVILWLGEVLAAGDVQVVAYDAWNINRFRDELEQIGIDLRAGRVPLTGSTMMLQHPQSFLTPNDKPRKELWPSMPRSINNTEELILTGQLRALRSPVLRSAVLGATPIRDNHANRKLAKEQSTTRIDAAIAMVQACGVLFDMRTRRRGRIGTAEEMFL